MFLPQNLNKKKNSNGRWSQVQHDRFMKALQKYGGDWISIQKLVKSRTVTQVRSHAQKVFMKMDQRDIDELLFGERESNETMEQLEQKVKVKGRKERSDKREKISLMSSLRLNSENEREERSSQKLQNLLNKGKEKISFPIQHESFFLQIFRENEKHFMNGGNFLCFVGEEKIGNKKQELVDERRWIQEKKDYQ